MVEFACFVANTLRERRKSYIVRSDGGDKGEMWAVLYDDGMSLTTASERVAHTLAEAERRRGHRVTVQRLDDVETHQPEPVRPAERLASPEPVSEPGPAPVPGPAPAPAPERAGLTRQPGPARAVTPARSRRLLLYALAAACIVVAAALAGHWNVLPRIGASTSPTQAGSLLHGPWLLPPLGQPPVMHFGGGP